MASGEPRRPFVEYADYSKDPDNYVRICVDIKGLKKKTFGKGAANSEIKFDLSERSFCLHVVVNARGKSEVFEYKINQLPEQVSTDKTKSYWKIKRDEEIVVMLHKVKSGSWARYFGSSGPGLETEEEQPD